jgi:hypothetical protein
MTEFLFMSKLADRIGDRIMAMMCLLAGAGAAASSLLLIYGIQTILNQWSTLGLFGGVVACWCLLLLWTALMNLDFATRLRNLAALSRATNCAQPKSSTVY